MWMYDLAREQTADLTYLRHLAQLSLDAGYNAWGLYLEHRFAYPSAPWAAGKVCLTPEMVRTLERDFPDLQIVPFVNLLGHVEGFLYTEEGKRFAEERFKGMQACPSKPEFIRFAEQLLDDVMDCFSSNLIHIGADETFQLGVCETCAAKVNAAETGGKAELYGNFFAPLAQRVIDQGRTPGLWGDIYLEHPEALKILPKEAILFHWRYFEGPGKDATKLSQSHRVVNCPSLQTYNASWFHLQQSEQNVRDHLSAPLQEGICLTTWECGLMGNYATLEPAIRNAGEALNGGELDFLKAYGDAADWARLLDAELQSLGGIFAWDEYRSPLKSRLLMGGDPFQAWRHHGQELSGETGLAAWKIADQALNIAPDANYRGVAQFIRGAIEFIQFAEQARQAYAQDLPGVAIACLAPARQVFEALETTAKATRLNCGGSLADVERCRIAKEHVERVILRIKHYGDRSLGYLPSFEHLTSLHFAPHDQGAWWLVNRWVLE
jgi:hypothetical protein